MVSNLRAYGCIGTSPLFQNLEHLQISMSDIDDANFKKIYVLLI